MPLIIVSRRGLEIPYVWDTCTMGASSMEMLRSYTLPLSRLEMHPHAFGASSADLSAPPITISRSNWQAPTVFTDFHSQRSSVHTSVVIHECPSGGGPIVFQIAKPVKGCIGKIVVAVVPMYSSSETVVRGLFRPRFKTSTILPANGRLARPNRSTGHSGAPRRRRSIRKRMEALPRGCPVVVKSCHW